MVVLAALPVLHGVLVVRSPDVGIHVDPQGRHTHPPAHYDDACVVRSLVRQVAPPPAAARPAERLLAVVTIPARAPLVTPRRVRRAPLGGRAPPLA
jgi:hypothetical protein